MIPSKDVDFDAKQIMKTIINIVQKLLFHNYNKIRELYI